jgi:hypothetical protein
MRKTIPLSSQFKPRLARPRLLAPLPFLFAALCAMRLLAAQAPAPQPSSAPAHKAAHTHKRPSAAHAQPAPPPATPVAVAPPAPETPHWPVNETPAQPSVVWDSHGLRIEAENASLQEILQQICTVTGAKVEGMGADERVFGDFGPGQARDVLSQLLQGSAYNIIMIGDQGLGAPRQIVLSVRHSGDAQAAAKTGSAGSADEDTEVEEPPQPQQPPQPRPPGLAPGGPIRTPQQIMQEMQQRQQEMQQRQQQLQPPPN